MRHVARGSGNIFFARAFLGASGVMSRRYTAEASLVLLFPVDPYGRVAPKRTGSPSRAFAFAAPASRSSAWGTNARRVITLAILEQGNAVKSISLECLLIIYRDNTIIQLCTRMKKCTSGLAAQLHWWKTKRSVNKKRQRDEGSGRARFFSRAPRANK